MLGAFSQLGLEFFSIFEFDFGGGVGNFAALNIRLDFGLHFTNLSFKVVHDAAALDGVNIHGNIKSALKVD